MARCLYLALRRMLFDTIIPSSAVEANALRPPSGHTAWTPHPWR